MSNAFGFPRRPQEPAPDPRAVGRALREGGLASGQMPGAMAPPLAPGDALDEFDGHGYGEAADVRMLHRLRLMGAVRTGGAGQTGTGSAPPGEPGDDAADDDALMNAAVGEAMTRIGGGLMLNPERDPVRVERRRQDAMRLGITPFEAQLLQQSGGL